MLIQPAHTVIAFPYPDPPAPGAVMEVAPGILWLRFALPFLLNNVNVYLIEDHGGWAALDTGLGTEATKAAWDAAFAGPLHGQRLTRVICTHYHPDHMGLVGWLTALFDCPLSITRTEFLITKVLETSAFAANPQFYTQRGLPPDSSDNVSADGHGYLRLVTGLPLDFERLIAGQTLRIGGRVFEILTGGGHSPEQAMLYCAAEKLFFSADQVLTKISPNISVQAMEPRADPLGDYLVSLNDIRREIPDEVLVLPGHHVPFHGLHTRVGELLAHHEQRCGLITEAAKMAPRTAADLLPVLFKRQMDAHQMGFAFSETVAHTNFMVTRGDLIQSLDPDGVLRLRAV
jgi:glyoxylase-like metal-dependent hydrolase (beta-lactamase superfamily II)